MNETVPKARGAGQTPGLRVLPLAITFLLFVATIQAQQSLTVTNSSTFAPSPQQVSGQEEEELIQPSRPVIANSAEVQKAGVLQLEYGYEGNLRSSDFHSQQSAPLTLRFAVSSHLLLDFDLTTVESQKDRQGKRATSIGDSRLGFHVVALKESEDHPALAFAYFVKLPAASQEKGLGSGRVDHQLVILLSKKFGGTEVDFNAAHLIVGREQESGVVNGGQFALAASHESKEKGLGVQGELSLQTKESYQQKGAFALAAMTYKVSRRLRLDWGLRLGLNHDAPRVGLFAGTTIAVADFYRKK